MCPALEKLCSDVAAKMFHPPKIPQRQRNGNATGLLWVLIAHPLKCDVAPVVGCCRPLAIPNTAMGLINLINLGLNLLNCNGFAMSAFLDDYCSRTGDFGARNRCNG